MTLELKRKPSENNECLVKDIALHQEQIEAVGPILDRTCGMALQILVADFGWQSHSQIQADTG